MKIGILGGSFNPVHNGHIYLANKAQEFLKLDKMLIIPSGNPPHKKIAQGAENQDRLNMVNIAFSDKMNYNVSDIEIFDTKPCYSVNTLLALKKQYEKDSLYFIMGADMLLTLQDWYKPEIICENCVLVCAPRDKDEAQKLKNHSVILKQKYNAKVEILDIEPLSISSTQVREKIKTGENCLQLIPEKVYEYIEKRGLYKLG